MILQKIGIVSRRLQDIRPPFGLWLGHPRAVIWLQLLMIRLYASGGERNNINGRLFSLLMRMIGRSMLSVGLKVGPSPERVDWVGWRLLGATDQSRFGS